MQKIQTGYLVLADLSGFTPYMATTELDHAQGILSSVFDLLRSRLTPVLQLAEVEGDALFLFTPGYRVTRGETLLEVIESSYVAFRDKLQMMRRTATCPCQACQAIPTLDLKFVTHCGEYVVQDPTGVSKPFGSSVNLAHRLLKNSVTEATGWPAYALFTEEALEHMDVRPEGMYVDRVSYEHLGEIQVGAIDLRRRYDELTAERSAYLSADQAHFTHRRRFAAPAAVLWDFLNDPHKRVQWEIGSDWGEQQRPRGRTEAGSHNHCASSDFTEQVLDWRPIDYYTVRETRGSMRFMVTGELHAEGDGTEVRWSIAMERGVPRVLRAAACRFFAGRLMKVPERFERLARLLSSSAELIPPEPVPRS